MLIWCIIKEVTIVCIPQKIRRFFMSKDTNVEVAISEDLDLDKIIDGVDMVSIKGACLFALVTVHSDPSSMYTIGQVAMNGDACE
jgi:hypothetical protein